MSGIEISPDQSIMPPTCVSDWWSILPALAIEMPCVKIEPSMEADGDRWGKLLSTYLKVLGSEFFSLKSSLLAKVKGKKG